MGQGEVLQYLEKCNKPKSAKEISEALGKESCNHSIQTLRRHGEIKFKKIKCEQKYRFRLVYWVGDEN